MQLRYGKMATRLLMAMAFGCMIQVLATSDDFSANTIDRDGDWSGWTTTGEGWIKHEESSGNENGTASYLWRSGELTKGTLRSPVFEIAGDFMTLVCNGWDGQEGGRNLSYFQLCRAKDDKVLHRISPPQTDQFVENTWVVSDLTGENVYFEAVDQVSDRGFAWIGVKELREKKKTVSGSNSLYRAVTLPSGTGIWGITDVTGGDLPTSSYLSSRVGGESQTGSLVSPTFDLTEPTITMTLRGHDTHEGGKGLNRVELLDAESGEVLRQSAPPQSDEATAMEWNTADLQGKAVKIRLTDECEDGGYAWLGIDAVDAGADYQVDFGKGQEALNGWHVPQAQRSYTDIDGVPFLMSQETIVPLNGSIDVPLGFKAKRLFLVGLTNTIEQGFVWAPFEDRSARFFLGDRLGEVRVNYSDGSADTFSLILGDNIWFAERVKAFPEPFKSYPQARKTLSESLNVYPAEVRADQCYLTALNVADQKIRNIRFTDSPEKAGAPIVRGITVEVRGDEEPKGTVPLGHDQMAATLNDYIENKGCYPESSNKGNREERLSDLRNVIYTTTENFPTSVDMSAPDDYKGPIVRLEGSPEAEVLGNIFHYNLHDMFNKVDERGMYHTSSLNAPSWGGYNGIGTWHPSWSSYYSQVWARDMGRALMELIESGYIDKARLCADYSIMMGQVWEKGPQPEMEIQNIGAPLTLDGHPVPFHWDRRLNIPDSSEGEMFDNDSHGLTMLFIYNLWRRLPDRDQWLRDRWEWIEKGGDWIKWQFDNPELSNATEYHIYTHSESSGGPGFSIYPEYCCMEGLRGFAEMAESIGKDEKAREWRTLSARLQKGIAQDYPAEDDQYGTVWTLKHSGWPHHTTVLAPAILGPDRKGYLPQHLNQNFLPITSASFDRIVDQSARTTPRGAYGSAMGYSQGFITQCALLLDRMDDAEEMLKWTARLTYYHVPDNEAWRYIVPEGAEIHTSGKYWFRTGDLGNGVQQAETVKSIRLLLGIDNTDYENLGIYPRMPQGWTKISVKEYPVWYRVDDRIGNTKIAYTLTRRDNRMTLEASFGQVYPAPINLRLGGFDKLDESVEVRLNGKSVQTDVIQSGDSYWLSLTVSAGQKEFQVEVIVHKSEM